jgi:tetratricopeptide (TPR) repeat protein
MKNVLTRLILAFVLICTFALSRTITYAEQDNTSEDQINSHSETVINTSKNETFDQGIKAFNENSYDEAIDSFQSFLEENPENIEAIIYLGMAYRSAGEYDQAIEKYKRALELDPDRKSVFQLLGVAFLLNKNIEEGKVYLEKYREQEPDDPDAYFNLGALYSMIKQYQLAAEYFDQAIKKYPRSKKTSLADAWLNKGLNSFKEGSYSESIEHIEKALKYDNQNGLASYYMGLNYIYNKPQNLEKAKSYIDKSKALGYQVPDYIDKYLEIKEQSKKPSFW